MFSFFARLWALLFRLVPRASPPKHPSGIKLLLVVEGPHDIEFLKRASAILHGHDPHIPDLAALERQGRLVFIPFGGGDLWLWTTRLAGIGLQELHIYDREQPPETEARQEAADVVNMRANCRALLTKKRSLENYLHPLAIREVCGVDLHLSDDDSVADLLARRLHERETHVVPWSELPRQGKTKRRNRVKHRLHTKAVDRMTPERFTESDPEGEIVSWLLIVAELTGYQP